MEKCDEIGRADQHFPCWERKVCQVSRFEKEIKFLGADHNFECVGHVVLSQKLIAVYKFSW